MSDAFRLIKDLTVTSVKAFQKDNCPQLAAGITYYVLFSIFPLLIFLAGIVGLFLSTSTQQDVVNQVLKQIPLNDQQGRRNVADAVKALSGPRAPVFGAIGLLGMAWSASGMFAAVRRSLNIINGDAGRPRPWFWQKVVDLSLVLGVGVFIGASIAASAALRIVQVRADDLAWAGRLSEHMGFAWTLGEILAPLVFSLSAFAVLYTRVPSQAKRLADAWPGAVVAGLAFELVKFGFSFYVTNFSNFDLVFGSLGAVATFMFWVFISAQIMLFGAEVADVYPRLREGAKRRQEKLAGMGEPLQARLTKAVRRLFVRD